MLGIVVSRADEASTHVGEHLRDLADWDAERDESQSDAEGGGTVLRTDGAVLREFDERHLDLVRPADAYGDVDLLVFASRHAGDTGRLLTAHHTGNVGPADHGGQPNELARACPAAHSRVLAALADHAPTGYDVGMECTHHGPSDVDAPSMFVELGSGPEQWADAEAARAVAAAILDLRGVAPDRHSVDGTDAGRRHVAGFGGGHYAPRFERIVRETDWAVGHVAADWALDALGDPEAPEAGAVLEAVMTESRAAYALVADERPAVESVVEDLGYRVVDETWLRQTDGVLLDLVERVEAALADAEAIRYGEVATGRIEPRDVVVEDLPAGLLAEARGIDREATREGIAASVIALAADQGGTRPTGQVVVERPEARSAIVDELAPVLEARYDEVERAADAVVARVTEFDPERAATLGVPEGPKFGRLAAGEAVEVDGRTIPPEAVSETRVERFNLR